VLSNTDEIVDHIVRIARARLTERYTAVSD
jgi:hypothetical protein